MEILHIIKSRQTDLIKKIIEHQSKKNKIKVIDIKNKDISFKDVIDEIFSHDKVISW